MHPVILILLAIFTPIIYWVSFSTYKLSNSKELIKQAIPFSISGTDYTKTMLVLGDSTAVGVGANTSSDSVPAKVAAHFGATYVENHAVSGAQIHDLGGQIQKEKLKHYDVILLQIGANDITRFHDEQEAVEMLEPSLVSLRAQTDKLIFISAGNVGGAPAIPPPMRPFYTRLNLKYHKAFEELATKTDVMYVNLYQDPSIDPFVQNPKTYFAKDGFHPSSVGYQFWFETIKEQLSK